MTGVQSAQRQPGADTSARTEKISALDNALSVVRTGGAGFSIDTTAALSSEAGTLRISFDPHLFDWRDAENWIIASVASPYTADRGHDRKEMTRANATVGECCILPPGTPFSIRFLGQATLRYLVIDAERFARAPGDTLEQAPNLDRLMCEFRSPVINALLSRLFQIAESRETAPQGYTDAMADAVIAEIMCLALPAEPEKRPIGPVIDARLLRRLEDRIASETGPSPMLPALAEEAGIPLPRFSRLFKAATGQTPHQYMIRLRLEKAQDLLANSDCSLAQIAFACGFSSQSHMTDVFRNRMGITPGAIRRAVR